MASKTIWFLLYCELDDSYSIVDSDSVLNSEEVELQEMVTFFYGNRSFIGKVISKTEDRNILDVKLNKLGKVAKRAQRDKSDSLSIKRQKRAPKKFSPSLSSTPDKVATKPIKIKDTAKKAKEVGDAAMSKQIIQLGGDMLAVSNENISSDSDDEEVLSMIRDKASQKAKRQLLLTNVRKSLDSANSTSVSIPSTSTAMQQSTISNNSSPSKEELKKLLLQYEAKLACAFPDSKGKPYTNDEPDVTASVTNSEILNDSLEINNDHEDQEKEPCPNKEGSFGTVKSLSKEETDNSKSEKDEGEAFNKDMLDPLNQDSNQLYGQNYADEEMVLLVNGIYCRKSVLTQALKTATKPSHLVRRMISGVFKDDAIAKSTLTGQRPRAAGKDNYEGEVSGLHVGAMDAIYAYAKKVAKIKKWEKNLSDADILRKAASQRIGEITRHLKNKNKST